MSKLPDTPSKLIRVALDDLEAVRNDNRYVVNFAEWHIPYTNKFADQFSETLRCSVCFAGSVMAKSLNVNINVPLTPTDFPKEGNKLKALDHFRRGHIRLGLHELDIPREKIPPVTVMDVNQRNYEEFVSNMEAIIAYLEKHNL